MPLEQASRSRRMEAIVSVLGRKWGSLLRNAFVCSFFWIG